MVHQQVSKQLATEYISRKLANHLILLLMFGVAALLRCSAPILYRFTCLIHLLMRYIHVIHTCGCYDDGTVNVYDLYNMLL